MGVPAKLKEKGGLKGLLSGLILADDERRNQEKEIEEHQRQQQKAAKSRERERDREKLEKEDSHLDWREFKAGTYTFPICIALPANLPPTLHADFGSNQYMLRALVQRSGPLTPNLSAEREITLIHAPDEEEVAETDNIIVQRTWEDAMSYVVAISGRSFALNSKIPIWLKFVPLTKVRIHRIVATLEEKTDYYAKSKRVARHEVPRRWTLLKLVNTDGTPILPLSDAPSSASDSVMGPFVTAALEGSSDAALSAMLNPSGPWELVADLELSLKNLTRINLSSNHSRSNIAVHHMLRITIRIEREEDNRGVTDGGKKKLFDIVIEAPIALNHSFTNDDWIKLPNYAFYSQDVSPGAASPGAGGNSRSPANGTVLAPGVVRAAAGSSLSLQASVPNIGAAGPSRQLTHRWLALSQTAGRFGNRLELPGEQPLRASDEPTAAAEELPPPSYHTAVFERPVLHTNNSEEIITRTTRT